MGIQTLSTKINHDPYIRIDHVHCEEQAKQNAAQMATVILSTQTSHIWLEQDKTKHHLVLLKSWPATNSNFCLYSSAHILG